jgi:glycosyltransferase involved in cell wall biosynthesis
MAVDFLYLLGDLGDGGQERDLYFFARSLKKKGYTPVIAVWDLDKNDKYYPLFTELGIELIDLTQYTKLQRIMQLRAIVKARKPKVFNSFTFHLNFPVFLACLFTATKSLGGIKNRLELYRRDSSLPLFLVSCFTPRHQLSNNARCAEGFSLAWLFKLWNKTYVLRNSMDVDVFTTEYYPKNDGVIRTVSVGRMFSEKRIDLIIQLIHTLHEKGYKIQHRHAGKGPLADQLNQMVVEWGMESYFEFAGTQTAINQFIKESDFLIHASDYEGCPNAVMEGMASGRPVLSTDCGDVSFLIEDGVNGFVTPVGDLNALVEKAIVLINDEAMRLRMGPIGRQKAATMFPHDVFTDKNLEIYQQL